jgi:hypothetical protein
MSDESTHSAEAITTCDRMGLTLDERIVELRSALAGSAGAIQREVLEAVRDGKLPRDRAAAETFVRQQLAL